MQCQSCGNNYIDKCSFCTSCGHQLKAHCSCSFENEPEDHFCGGCGKSIKLNDDEYNVTGNGFFNTKQYNEEEIDLLIKESLEFKDCYIKE